MLYRYPNSTGYVANSTVNAANYTQQQQQQYYNYYYSQQQQLGQENHYGYTNPPISTEKQSTTPQSQPNSNSQIETVGESVQKEPMVGEANSDSTETQDGKIPSEKKPSESSAASTTIDSQSSNAITQVQSGMVYNAQAQTEVVSKAQPQSGEAYDPEAPTGASQTGDYSNWNVSQQQGAQQWYPIQQGWGGSGGWVNYHGNWQQGSWPAQQQQPQGQQQQQQQLSQTPQVQASDQQQQQWNGWGQWAGQAGEQWVGQGGGTSGQWVGQWAGQQPGVEAWAGQYQPGAAAYQQQGYTYTG